MNTLRRLHKKKAGKANPTEFDKLLLEAFYEKLLEQRRKQITEVFGSIRIAPWNPFK